MPDPETKKTAELLAEWRAAGRDTIAARAAAHIAALALEAATAAEEAANEVEAAAKAALDAVEKARAAAARARDAATQAAAGSGLVVESAQGEKVRANHDVLEAEHAEADARDAFHAAEERAHDPS